MIEENNMTIKKLLYKELVNNETTIFIRDNELNFVTKGFWYQDNILNYRKTPLEDFTWQDDNKIYLTLKA